MRLAFTSVRGAPGTTTLALATAIELGNRGRDVLLIEADPAGGVLTAELSLPLSPGLLEFSADPHFRDIAAVTHGYVPQLNDKVCVLTGPSSPRQATAALEAGASRLADMLHETEDDVVLDVGRAFPASASSALSGVADRIVYVVRPVVAELAALISSLGQGESESQGRILAVVDPPPHSANDTVHPREAAEVLAKHGTVLAVPWDPTSVRRLQTEPCSRKWARAPLGIAVARLVDEVSSPGAPAGIEPAADLPTTDFVTAGAVS